MRRACFKLLTAVYFFILIVRRNAFKQLNSAFLLDVNGLIKHRTTLKYANRVQLLIRKMEFSSGSRDNATGKRALVTGGSHCHRYVQRIKTLALKDTFLLFSVPTTKVLISDT